MPKLGYKITEEHRQNLIASHLGQKAWNKGKPLSASHVKALRLAMKGFTPKHLPPRMHGSENPAWKGDKVSYRNIHRWVVYHLGKACRCVNDASHQSTRFHWANISGEYKRDLSDWHQLCPSCNKKDGVKIAPRFRKEG